MEKIHYHDTTNTQSETVTYTIEDKATMNKLKEYFNHYKVKASKERGWVSHNPSDFSFEYKGGEFIPFTFDSEIVASYRIYHVVNGPMDDKWLKEFI